MKICHHADNGARRFVGEQQRLADHFFRRYVEAITEFLVDYELAYRVRWINVSTGHQINLKSFQIVLVRATETYFKVFVFGAVVIANTHSPVCEGSRGSEAK